MNRDSLRAEVLAQLAEVAPEVDPESLDPKESFRDQFDMDSVDFLNFVLGLEKRLGLTVPETEYPRLASLSGALDWLEAHGGA